MTSIVQDASITQLSATRWRGEMKPGWRVGVVPNGGYVLAVAAGVIQQALEHKDPLSINAFYLAPTEIGEFVCDVDILRQGKNTSFVQLRLIQNDELKATFTAAYTELDGLIGEDWSSSPPPTYPDWQQCEAVPFPKHIEYGQQVELRLTEGAEIYYGKTPPNTGRLAGWVRFTNDITIDPLSLMFINDCLPPPIFTCFGFQAWVPTVELTVQIRRRPAAGPVKVRYKTTQLTKGVMEQDCEIWDGTDQLVCMSRQTAKIRVSKK